MRAAAARTRPPAASADVAPAHAAPEEIAGYVDANRAALDRTLGELERRVSPQGFIDLAVDRLRHGGGAQYAQALRDAVVRNPLPVALTALGLAWTLFADRQAAVPDGDGDRLRRGPTTLPEGGEKARVRDRMGRGIHAAESRAQAWGSAAAERSRASAARAGRFSREHPLILTGAGLTLGAAIAALLPSVGGEARRPSYARDAVVEEAGNVAERPSESAVTGGEPAEAVAYRSSGHGGEGGLDVPRGSDQGPGTEGGGPPARGR